MALQQTATAAVRLVRVTSLTDRDADALVQAFGLHPHDREALFSSSAKPLVRSYRNYSLAVIPWPLYDVTQNDLRATTIRLIVADGQIALITDTTLPPIEDYWQSLLTMASATDQAASLSAATVLLQLAKWTAGSVPMFLNHLSPSIDDGDRVRFVQALQSAAAALEELSAALANLALVVPEASLTFRLARHLLTHAASRLSAQRRSPTRRITAPVTMLPRLVGGYVLASAIIALLVLIAVR